MKTRKVLSKALTGVLVGGLLLTAGGMAIAADTTVTTPNPAGKVQKWDKPFVMMKKGGFGQRGGQGLLTNLDQLVKDGTITQAKADEIKAFLEKAAQERQAKFEEMQKLSPEERKALHDKIKAENQGKIKVNLFTQLVENKILTQEQADAVQAKLKELNAQQRKQKVTEALDGLVNQGTITKEQGDKVLGQLEAKQKEKEALHQKLQNMTVEERQKYMQDNKGQWTDPLSQLVKDKVITDQQAKEIRKAVGFHGGHKKGHMKGFMKTKP